MSSYRDDTQETAVASSSTWIRVTAITEEAARIASTVLFALTVVHADAASISDSTFGNARYLVQEQANASDTVVDGVRAREQIAEDVTVVDAVTERLRVLHADGAGAGDSVTDRLRSTTLETAHLVDGALATRHVHSLVVDAARASDATGQAASVLLSEAAVAEDFAIGTLRARVVVQEIASAGDEVRDARQAGGPAVEERAALAALVLDHLHARDAVADGAIAEDLSLSEGAGQCWTANVDTWAMSRYAPHTFSGFAVIDGVLYGMAADGVYALDGGSDVIEGSVVTGKLDLGRGVLVHPTAAYLEYELDGAATMEVTSTQSGAAETYAYALPPEPAAELTNGRFIFGRGLRGRHFSFAMRLVGRRGYINDLRVETAPTKRRV